MNRTIKLLMLSDIFFITGFGLMDPILAIFIKDNLVGGTILGAGLASMLFILTKCVIQLPFSKYVDEHDDKVKWLIIGTFLVAFVPFIYYFATDIRLIYLGQFIHGIGAGFAFPTWLGLWSTNLDKKRESFEWSLYSTLTGIGTAITAVVGATIAQFLGFKYTFIFVWIMSLIGCSILLALEHEKHKGKSIDFVNYHKKLELTNGKNH